VKGGGTIEVVSEWYVIGSGVDQYGPFSLKGEHVDYEKNKSDEKNGNSKWYLL